MKRLLANAWAAKALALKACAGAAALYYKHALIAALGAVVVLWQMLLPGYVLTLDMVFGPHAAFPSYEGLSAAAFPYRYLIYLLHFWMPVWVIQKGILFGLFYLLFYLPLRFYPFEDHRAGRYFASALFAVNPFVYERMLAGQWGVLMAYAFLFPLACSLTRLYRTLAWRHALHACAWLLCMGMFSLHIMVMGCVLLAVFALASVTRMLCAGEYRMARALLGRLCACGLLFALASLYWLVPAFAAPATALSDFGAGDVRAFYTASDPVLGTAGNVAALYGFWGEHERWITYFAWPKESGLLWALSGIALAGVVCAGVVAGLRRRGNRFIVLWLCGAGALALVFSSGIGPGIFQNANAWMFNHVPFWSGFRDTQKWSAVLVLAYALVGGLGAGYIASRFKRPRLAMAALCCIPLLYTPTTLFGLAGQLRPVWYPDGWATVNDTLKRDDACAAVFLPWHLYYTPVFNNRLLTTNTSSSYFDCTIYQGASAEIGEVGDGGQQSRLPGYARLSAAITDNDADPDETLRLLAGLGIRYVIYTPDEAHDDPYSYPFLGSAALEKVISTPSVDLYRVAD